jgi:hypothetical protein
MKWISLAMAVAETPCRGIRVISHSFKPPVNIALKIGTGGGEDHSVGVEHFVADFQSDIGQHLMTPHHVHGLKADKLDSCSSHLNQLPSSLP